MSNYQRRDIVRQLQKTFIKPVGNSQNTRDSPCQLTHSSQQMGRMHVEERVIIEGSRALLDPIGC